MRSGLPGLVDQAEGSTFACSDLGVVAGQLWLTVEQAHSSTAESSLKGQWWNQGDQSETTTLTQGQTMVAWSGS